VDERAFCYISPARWKAILAEARNKQNNRRQRQTAFNMLRKFDGAGRIMETDEGVPAPNPCSWCTRDGYDVECRVFKDRDDTSCAYCKRMGKPRCTAKQVATDEAQEDEYTKVHRVEELEERLLRAEALLRNYDRRRRRVIEDDEDEDGDEEDNDTEHSDTAGQLAFNEEGDEATESDYVHVRAEADGWDEMGDDQDVSEEAAMHRLTTFCFNPHREAFETKTVEKSVGVNDVLIRTTHSGLCYKDVHAKGKGCGLRHEGVSIIEDVGEAVTHLQAGDRAGWGWLHSVSHHR